MWSPGSRGKAVEGAHGGELSLYILPCHNVLEGGHVFLAQAPAVNLTLVLSQT